MGGRNPAKKPSRPGRPRRLPRAGGEGGAVPRGPDADEGAALAASRDDGFVWSDSFGHKPVMLREALDCLQVREDGFYVDATLGGGGHSRAILGRLGEGGRLLSLDVDPEPLAWARAWGGGDPRLILRRQNFSGLAGLLQSLGLGPADGVLADLGLSSRQLLNGGRGFSFAADGPLDMRLDPAARLSAAEIVNTYSEESLRNIFWRLGEERGAARLAGAVVEAREKAPFETTFELAGVASKTLARGGRPGRLHPATKAFMALRLAVNGELDSLAEFLGAARGCLRTGGRLVVISFHSLEDRLVKRALRGLPDSPPGPAEFLPPGPDARGGASPAPFRQAGRGAETGTEATEGAARWRLVRRKAVRPSEDELLDNPRARSARLRAAEAV
ncbi:MAG: 16S rRNA (cytosine(1402)-N(4))-methyltransferase RsmH [Deltaproteobacteria bacterium]|nr:16S rRNA (cytosine(1402)-N(4))-methyltransferase RsmH [Deltaproteobacteria bacterium]